MIFKENLKGIALVTSEINSVKNSKFLLLQAETNLCYNIKYLQNGGLDFGGTVFCR